MTTSTNQRRDPTGDVDVAGRRTRVAARHVPVIAIAFALATLVLYVRTVAPSVATIFDDSLEFQVVLPTLGIAHPSGYPLYTLLGKLFILLLPLGDPAGRANLLSALAAALAAGGFYVLAARLARNRLAAAIVTIAFAISPAWWSQATLSEVYALHGLFVVMFLYLLIRWQDAITIGRRGADRWLAGAAAVAGLGLTHHRMIALLLPAALIFVLWTDPDILRRPRRWIVPVVLGIAPLLLYLYLPLRGQAVSSLDGTFVPTPGGTVDWIMARGYGVFLTGNPFGVHRTAGFFVGLVIKQLGPLLTLAAIMGLAIGWRFELRRYTLLLVSTVAQLAFGVAYKVQDIEVFFIPVTILLGLWAALGLVPWLDGATAWLATQARQFRLPSWTRAYLLPCLALLSAGLMLFEPIRQAIQTFPEQDRSQAWGVYDYGQDMLASVAPNGEIVGLQGEITLARYFRDVLGQRPDVGLVAADAEPARYAAIADALARGRPIYLTRDLPGAASRYSLDAAGPLIAVTPKAKPSTAATGQDMGDGVRLVNAQAGVRQTHSGPVIRVAATWTASRPIAEVLKVSARLVDAGGQTIAPPQDQEPAHFAYPTKAWIPGEMVEDIYDLPGPANIASGDYQVLLILYRAADGKEVGRYTLPPSSIVH